LPTQASDGIATVAKRLAGLLREVAAEGGNTQPLACGIAAPGLINSTAGEIRYAANLPGAQHFPLRQRLEDELSIPVVVDNDLRMHALGESHFGAAKGCSNFLLVAVGTGVGGALFLDGQPYRGARHSAGEIGHIPLDEGPQAPLCGCGRRGCLEAFASGPAIAAYFRRRAVEAGIQLDTAAPELKEITNWLSLPNLKGDLAREAVSSGARALGRGLGIAANLLDPERIILGGGVSRIGETWLNTVLQSMNGFTLNQFEASAIQLSQLGEDAALLGAAVLAGQLYH